MSLIPISKDLFYIKYNKMGLPNQVSVDIVIIQGYWNDICPGDTIYAKGYSNYPLIVGEKIKDDYVWGFAII